MDGRREGSGIRVTFGFISEIKISGIEVVVSHNLNQ
jgi:hypothetical protein